ncbi:MAG: ABC transporter ATP-binding protein [Chloroflexi bacterium]|nr:ABC transporter ATP-binding protein [Chloroflexota bacterium]
MTDAGPSVDSIVRAEGLEKAYRINGSAVGALRGVNLDIARGEFVAIVGPSGSGKSTLLNLLGGLTAPTKGCIVIDGNDLMRLSADQVAELRRRTLGFVFQSFNLSPVLTAQENVELPMLLAGVAAKERIVRAAELLSAVGLEDKLDYLPGEMSGGQKQRVAIARALANRPRVLLADEPTGNLDSATAREVMDLLIRTHVEHASALVMVTHDPDDAARADRRVRMRDGQIQTTEDTVK